MTEDGGDRLSRWSRLKLAAKEPEPEPEPELEVAALEPEPEPEIVEGEIPEAELLEQLGLPDPDTLAPGDDFSAFMPKSVPDFLRRRALRRLWLSNPLLANVDGLVDYGEDFTDAAMVPEVLNTVYQVGRGMVDKVEKALDELAEAASGDGAQDGAPVDQAEGEAEGGESPDAVSEIEASPAPVIPDPSGENVAPGVVSPEPPTPVQPLHRPRRMRFEAS